MVLSKVIFPPFALIVTVSEALIDETIDLITVVDKVSLTFYVLAFGGQKLVANFTNKPYCEIVTRKKTKYNPYSKLLITLCCFT